MPFVLDASVTMAWCFPDEATPYSEAVLDQLLQTEAVVPSVWPLEVANVLLVAMRRQRLDEARLTWFLGILPTFPIRVDGVTLDQAVGAVLRLARDQRLSAYDASYLELALRQGLPLTTQDERLRTAAQRVGVPLVP